MKVGLFLLAKSNFLHSLLLDKVYLAQTRYISFWQIHLLHHLLLSFTHIKSLRVQKSYRLYNSYITNSSYRSFHYNKFFVCFYCRKFDTIENRILHYLLFTCFTTIGEREENKTHFPWLYLIYIYIYINLNFVYITLTLENTKLLFVIVVSLSVECDYQVLNWQVL